MIKIEGKDYPVYLSFASLPLGYLINSMQFEQPMERLAAISNIPLTELSKLSFDSLAQIFECYGYADKLDLLGEDKTPYEIGNDSWGKFEQAKLLIKDEKDSAKIALSIASVYTGKPYVTINCLEAWQEIRSYLNGFIAFNEKYKRLNEWQPTVEQQLAGIDRFEQFGIMPQFFEVRKGYPNLTDDEVWALPAEQIYYKFLIDFEQSQFDKAYSEVMSKKK